MRKLAVFSYFFSVMWWQNIILVYWENTSSVKKVNGPCRQFSFSRNKKWYWMFSFYLHWRRRALAASRSWRVLSNPWWPSDSNRNKTMATTYFDKAEWLWRCSRLSLASMAVFNGNAKLHCYACPFLPSLLASRIQSFALTNAGMFLAGCLLIEGISPAGPPSSLDITKLLALCNVLMIFVRSHFWCEQTKYREHGGCAK